MYHKEDVKIGDWIETDFHHDLVQVGFITEVKELEVRIYTVRIGNKKQYQLANTYRNVFYQSIDRLNDIQLTKENIQDLIDLALITDDKEWFNELSVRLGSAKSIKNKVR